MVIKASAAAEVRTLIGALGGPDPLRREAAIARLSVIGPRAVDRLLSTYRQTTDRAVRHDVLRVFQTVADYRVSDVARDALAGGGDLGVAAAGVLGTLLDATHADASAQALDALVAAALDRRAEHRLRVAALDALQAAPPHVRDRVSDALREDSDASVQASLDSETSERAPTDALWNDAIEGHLPDDPQSLRAAVNDRGGSAALASLQKLVDAVRAREAASPDEEDRRAWQAVRGLIHQTLALRGSRVALYDLRESVESAAAPLPASFMGALQALGDSLCLEPIASAYSRTSDPAWQHQLASAMRVILRREKITRRSAVVKRVLTRAPALASEITGAA